jgi:thiol-disulfide isomerase/thioredoxin
MFYTDTCTYCKELVPAISSAASQLKSMGVPVVIAKVDLGTTGGELIANRYNYSSIPTLIWFVNGAPSIINLNDGDWANKQYIVSFATINSGFYPSSPSALSDDPCKDRRLGNLCLSIAAPAFYAVLAISVAHIVQALAWVVISRKKMLFSFAHFFAVLFVPVFGLAMWLPLCRNPKITVDRKTLLHDLSGA